MTSTPLDTEAIKKLIAEARETLVRPDGADLIYAEELLMRDLTDELETAASEVKRLSGLLAKVTAEAAAIRKEYLSFWGSHSPSDLDRVREPKMPTTPALDAIPNDESEAGK